MKKRQVCLAVFLSLMVNTVFADCSSSPILYNVPLKFYSNPLGIYTIFFSNTLSAIADGQADQNGYVKPYYEKSWRGSCPGGLDGNDGTCNEYTVYPNDTNFSPSGIMEKIEQYTDGNPNRGEVRILTDNDESHYVYTTDHEETFCGPYLMPPSTK